MLPNLTPPTDNLYKFIALFGLTILLFSFYKSSEVFEHSARTKSNIEDVRREIHDIYWSSIEHHKHPMDTMDTNVSPFTVRDLSDDLHEIAATVGKSNLNDSLKFDIDTKIRKMMVDTDVLGIKITEYFFILGLGFVLMIFGFIQWYRKDQRYRDKQIKSVKSRAMMQSEE
jgi:hypothetical protein